MSHVSQQIVDAIVEILTPIPELDGRVFRRGALGWDRRTYPMIVVNAGAAKISTNLSGSRRHSRVQDRTQQFVIEIHDLEDEGEEIADRPSRIAVEIERALTALDGAVPIDENLLVSDSGIVDLEPDNAGAHSAQALTYAVTYHTLEGDPSRFLEPNR